MFDSSTFIVTFMSRPTCSPLSRIHCYIHAASNLSSAIAHTFYHSCRDLLIVDSQAYIVTPIAWPTCSPLYRAYIVTFMSKPTCRRLSCIHCNIHVATNLPSPIAHTLLPSCRNQLVLLCRAYIVTFVSQPTCCPLSPIHGYIYVTTNLRPLSRVHCYIHVVPSNLSSAIARTL